MTTLDELERLARAATPGPWIRSGCRRKMGDEDCIMVGPDGFLMAALPIGQPRDHAGAFNDAAFIAAANPATILALLSERAELLAAVERMRRALEPFANKDNEFGSEVQTIADTALNQKGDKL